jgi:HK97 family phage prohead protease
MAKRKQFLPPEYETREITSKLEAGADEKKKFLRGFIPYNSRSDHYNEIIAPGAFKKTMQERTIVALINHDANQVLGSTKNGTVSFEDSEQGLSVIVELPDTTYARDAWAVIERGDVDTMSFGFQPVTVTLENGMDVLKEVRLFEVSFLVAFPAYEETTSGAFTRSALMKLKNHRGVDFEKLAALASDPKDMTAEDKAEIESGLALLQSLRDKAEPAEPPAAEPPNSQPSADPDTGEIEALAALVELETALTD